MTKTKDFVPGLTISPVLGLTKEKEDKNEVAPHKHRFGCYSYNYQTEILDEKEGWIYEKKRGNKKGKRLRKYFEKLGRSYGDDKSPCFWKPKLDDLAYCEEKRWKALQYQQNQYKKITGAFDLVLNNTPFCCIRIVERYPGFAWIEFPHNENYLVERRGVSWDWWESSYRNKKKLDKPDSPLKQDVGDAWFYYEERSREIRRRVSYFEQLFHMSLEKKYADAFYRSRNGGDDTKLKLVINGREYLIGIVDGRSFGVIAYPENVITQVVEKLNSNPSPTALQSQNE